LIALKILIRETPDKIREKERRKREGEKRKGKSGKM